VNPQYLIHPLELPINQTAAQTYSNNFADQISIDAWANLPAPHVTVRTNASAANLPANDPRQPGQGTSATATATGVAPTSGAHGTATSITITGTNLTTTKKVNIGKDCTQVTVVSATSVTAKTPGNVGAGAQTAKITFADMGTINGPTYTYT